MDDKQDNLTYLEKKQYCIKNSKKLSKADSIDVGKTISNSGYRNSIKFCSDGGHINLDALEKPLIDSIYSQIKHKLEHYDK